MSDAESSEDEIEPKLKYARLSNDIQNILSKSSATSIAVHPKVTTDILDHFCIALPLEFFKHLEVGATINPFPFSKPFPIRFLFYMENIEFLCFF